MCGIAGAWAYRDGAPVDAAAVVRMREAMAPRGPDGRGLWTTPAGDLVLGHRRLAILDLSDAGAQPMVDPESGNVVVYNGEIYNFPELRAELEARGVRFRTRSDTEALLHLYRLEGERMVERLRGMFAFALWDARAQRLLLARDPLGIKPLYVADDGRVLRFASQVKALLASGEVAAEPCPAGVTGFFVWGHVPEPWTWVRAVRALPAGSTLVVPRGGPVGTPRRYFDLADEVRRAEAAPPPAEEDGWCWFFGAVDHCTTEVVGHHVAKKGDRWAALEPIREGVRAHFGPYRSKVAMGLSLRHDWGPQYTADQFQGELRWLGIRSSPSYVGEPECNGICERFMRTLKEECIYVHRFRNLEEARGVIAAFIERYNHQWLVERHGYRTPAEVRRELTLLAA